METLLLLAASVGALYLFTGGSSSSSSSSGSGKPDDRPKPPIPTADSRSVEYGAYTLVATPDEDGTWDWEVFDTDVGAIEPDGAGFDAASADAAFEAARQWVIIQTGVDGGPIVEPPQPITRRGLRVSGDCTSITVVDLDKWIAHAVPVLQEFEEPNAEEVTRAALGQLFPECEFGPGTMIRGRPWEDVIRGVQNMINKAVAGELLDVATPEEVVAARMVGMSAPRQEGVAEWYVSTPSDYKWALLVTPTGSGNYHWRGWIGSRDDNEQPRVEGVAPTLADGLRFARQAANGVPRLISS